jgi:hypothetical protein
METLDRRIEKSLKTFVNILPCFVFTHLTYVADSAIRSADETQHDVHHFRLYVCMSSEYKNAVRSGLYCGKINNICYSTSTTTSKNNVIVFFQCFRNLYTFSTFRTTVKLKRPSFYHKSEHCNDVFCDLYISNDYCSP